MRGHQTSAGLSGGQRRWGAFMSDFPPLLRPRKTQTGKAPQTPAWGGEQRAPGSLNPSRSHTGRSGPARGSGPAWGRESPSVPAASSRPGTNPDQPTRGKAPAQSELAARWPRPDSSCRGLDRTAQAEDPACVGLPPPPARPDPCWGSVCGGVRGQGVRLYLVLPVTESKNLKQMFLASFFLNKHV